MSLVVAPPTTAAPPGRHRREGGWRPWPGGFLWVTWACLWPEGATKLRWYVRLGSHTCTWFGVLLVGAAAVVDSEFHLSKAPRGETSRRLWSFQSSKKAEENDERRKVLLFFGGQGGGWTLVLHLLPTHHA